MHRKLQPLLFVTLLTLLASSAIGQTGHLALQVVVVDELVPKPVALTSFVLAGVGSPEQQVRTDGDGKISLDLPAAHYKLRTAEAISFKSRNYTWSKEFDIRAGETTSITLTQADATVTDAPLARVVSDEAKLYQRFKNSVLAVQNDEGHGSGFLVDAKGLILTNFHVAGNSSSLAVRFGPGERYPAKLIASDPNADVAVIQVNPTVCQGREPVQFAPLGDALAVEGEKVVAIGSPLHQEKTLTTGIVSKVERDVLISDVNINHGNSGGPLLNMAGQALGITTFLDSTTNGPGISGIVSIAKATNAIAEARSKVDTTQPPSADKLPDVSSVHIPGEMLSSVAQGIKSTGQFFKAPKNFRTYIETPFEAYASQAQFEKELQKKIARRYKGKVAPADSTVSGPIYFWRRYVDREDQPLVTVRVLPWPQETSSSQWNRFLWGAAAGRAKLELRDDFARMTLLRDGVEVPAIYRIRQKNLKMYEGYDVEINDIAYAGAYMYDPRAFAPGAKLELRIWKNDRTDYTTLSVDKATQERIWNQYKGWAELAKASSQ